MSRVRSKNSIDWILLSLFGAIILIGWLMLYSSCYEGPGFWFDFSSSIGRQTKWLGVSLIAFIAILLMDWRIWNSLSYPIYILTTLSLVAVLFIGKEIKGATSWFSFLGYSLQPSEFAKLGTALAVSAYLSQININLEKLRTVGAVFGLFLFPSFLIFLQPDAGTAIVFFAFLVPLFRAGLNASLYILGFSLAFIFIGSLIWTPYIMLVLILLCCYLFLVLNIKDNRLPLSIMLLTALFAFASYSYLDYRLLMLALLGVGVYFNYLLFNEGKYRAMTIGIALIIVASALSIGTKWGFNNILKPHQQDRINVWLRPELCDPQGSLYNIIQSKTAIGSGGFSGKGFLDGSMTKLNYVPEQQTDFIFSILGEEQGFIGSFSLIILFTALLLRISIIAERSKLPFIRYYAYSVAGFIFFHFFINVGMTLGLMPVIGIPLSLMSKGGSSLLAFVMMIAILLKMDQSRA